MKDCLKKYSLLDDEALSDKYSRLIGFIEPQYQILNNTNVVTSIDTLSMSNPITKKYRIKSGDILTATTNDRTVKEDSWQGRLKKPSQAAWNRSTDSSTKPTQT